MDDITVGIRRLQRLLSSRRVFSRQADAAGVALAQQSIQVLQAMGSNGACSVADVARAAQMDVGAVSRQLRTLENERLVTRRPSSTNASVVLVASTAAGRKLAARFEDVQRRHLADALGAWSPEDRDALGRLLLRLVDDLQHTALRTE